MIRVTAPGRAGIIGNPTDGYGGALVSCSITERAEVTIEAKIWPHNPKVGERLCQQR